MAKENKEPGRIKQLIKIYQSTMAVDKTAIWWALLTLGIGALAGHIL